MVGSRVRSACCRIVPEKVEIFEVVEPERAE